uniref:F-box domain-containing protein n=1 Tax=Anopheles atroparvus TaxID=41427 RepID=A0AAG5DNZ2_ANOAO
MEPIAGKRTQICDLPVEVLEMIFDHLAVSDLKNASLVSRLWSNCAFSSQRMERVRLKIDYCLKEPEDYLMLFNESKRQYRHVLLAYSSEELVLEHFIQLLQNFKRYVKSLKIRPNMCIGVSQLRDILLEVPNLKALSVHSRLWNSSDTQDAPFQQFPMLAQLSDLVLESDMALQLEEFDVRLIAPNLRSLDMDCDSQRALEAYKHFSDQLTTIAVFFKNDDYFLRFCEVKFPNLYKIDFYSDDDQFRDNEAVRTIAAFFARLKRL